MSKAVIKEMSENPQKLIYRGITEVDFPLTTGLDPSLNIVNLLLFDFRPLKLHDNDSNTLRYSPLCMFLPDNIKIVMYNLEYTVLTLSRLWDEIGRSRLSRNITREATSISLAWNTLLVFGN